ncbi:MAG: sugar phosphate nucleotidyltransferase, partial [Desulfobacterales bacterium]
VMASVYGRPFLTFLLDQLRAIGIHRVILCTGYKADIVKDQIGEKYKNVNILYSEESQPLGTGGAIKLAQGKISSETFVVMNGDSYVNANLSRFFSWYESAGHSAAIYLTRIDNIKRYGHIITSKNGKIQKFIEKGSSSGSGWINAGVYLLNKRLFKSMPESMSFSLENDFFPSLISSGLHGYKDDTEFIDIGTPESFFQAEKFFLTLHLQ